MLLFSDLYLKLFGAEIMFVCVCTAEVALAV